MTAAPRTVRLADYRPSDYVVDRVHLDFDLGEEVTHVRSRLWLRRNPDAVGSVCPLVLDGEDLTLRSIMIDDTPVDPAAYTLDPASLTIHAPPKDFILETVAAIRPQDNTKLEGLYKSSGNFCTQCEPEGFRRITWYLDRPDVTAIFTTRITSGKTRYPVLLSNGNLVAEGEADDGRHWVEWHDPYRKPSYLFALVAGDLACVEDSFTTMSGRDVALRIYVEHGKEDRCGHAMASLKKAMRWGEERFGLEYDLDVYMIVAVSDFNMGAMENKGLNVFNDKYVLANPETATDADYAFIEAIVAHEYFHNWTGNRVTLRDWFQLSLKEGLTVFRDQEFSADVRSGAVKRIQDVRTLRARQFPEDAGPLAHPVRPASYIEINNFYTATVYEKGAELVRMIQTFVGRDGFNRGLRRYLAENDGRAATVEDFVSAMEAENDADLAQFMRWYGQAGTPTIEVEKAWDPRSGICELTFRQSCPATPGQPQKQPLHMPIRLGLMGRSGKAMALRLDGETSAIGTDRVVELRQVQQTFRFVDVPEEPMVSVLRGFYAPATLKVSLEADDRAFLLAHDDDLFNRWEAGQQFATTHLLALIEAIVHGRSAKPDERFIDALGTMLSDRTLDKSFVAEAILLPSEEYLGNQMASVDVEAIHQARSVLRKAIGTRLRGRLLDIYRSNQVNRPYAPTAEEAARRKLKNGALSYLMALDDPTTIEIGVAQFRAADNMTDAMAALGELSHLESPARTEALGAFYERWRNDPLVLDKWLALQAMSSLPETLDSVRELLDHPAFSIRNPNKVRALIGSFCAGNQLRFHASDGSGYSFLADQVLILDDLNPQVAARLLAPLGQWRRFDAGRQKLMRESLQRVLAKPNLSRDVYEIASKSLE